MMKLAIYFSDFRAEEGGANSLIQAIKKHIKNHHCSTNEISILYLYSGGIKTKYKILVGTDVYINISRVCIIAHLCKKICRKIFKISLPDTRLNTIGRKEAIDLFWFPTPVEFSLDYPYISTVWDLGHREVPYFPEVSKTGWKWEDREKLYTNMLYKASYVVTGNEEGKKEILENYPMPSNKIRIAAFPVSQLCYCKEKEPSFIIKNVDFFFYPAQFWPHKNHMVILDALYILRKNKGLKPIVYLTGSDKGNKNYILSEVHKKGLREQVIFTDYISDEEVKYLYTHATAMIFASLMGPNNMPPIEGTFLGCPIIITNLDGHKEQLSDTALYFNGYNPDELARQMFILLTDKEKREKIIAKQKKLAQEFNHINYFETINVILTEFQLIRRTWGEDFTHL